MKRRTLFDPKAVQSPSYYSHSIRCLYEEDSRSFCGEELSVFDDALEFERHFSLDFCGALFGNIVVKVGPDVVNVSKLRRTTYYIPIWPEPEHLQIVRCKAKGVLLIETYRIFHHLMLARADKTLDMILICAGGMPRFSTRRFAHRLCEQFKLPLYILADNDTWGYFMFSLMKRGVVDPAKEFPFAAVKDTRYIGMRCKDAEHFENAKEAKIPGKSYWKYRIAALRKYACFKSKAWQQEFDAFEKQKGKFELEALVGRKGIEYVVHEYLKTKLEQRDYLK